MIGRTVRIALVAVTLAVPAASARACHLFDRCCGRATTAYYAPAPVVAAYAPAPVCCPQPQVVNYMPQTCYRTVYVNTPVVAYQPMTACDACGRATTVMRPVTTFVARPQLVPYTTYRPVAVAAPVQPCCATAPATQTFYAPPVTAVPAAPACCSPASATTITPSLSTYSPAPVAAPIPAGTTTIAPTPTPTLQSVTPAPGPAPPTQYPAPPAGENKTFQSSPSDNNSNSGESRLLLPPRNDSSSSFSPRPGGVDADFEDRTTAIPVRGFQVRQASLIVPAKAETQKADDGGWRAAAR